MTFESLTLQRFQNLPATCQEPSGGQFSQFTMQCVLGSRIMGSRVFTVGSKFLFLGGPFIILYSVSSLFDLLLFCDLPVSISCQAEILRMGLYYSALFFFLSLFVGQFLYGINIANLLLKLQLQIYFFKSHSMTLSRIQIVAMFIQVKLDQKFSYQDFGCRHPI